MIPLTNTIIQPHTMMIHPLHTLITLSAMPDTWEFDVVAFLAIFYRLYKELVLELSIKKIVINAYCNFIRFYSVVCFS